MRPLRLSWSVVDGQECLRVDGLARSELASVATHASEFAVLPEGAAVTVDDVPRLQPTSGRFLVDGESLCFLPRFPFRDGAKYVVLRGKGADGWRSRDADRWAIERRAPAAGRPSVRVVALFPDVEEVPFNLLKFYVEFSAPMSEGFAAQAISIRRGDTGTPLEAVFASMNPELWDPARQRLTVLLDPGRIKRGLVPNAEAGYPLVEGVPIVVSISTDAADATGQPLAAPFERMYRVGPAVRQRVVPGNWTITPPVAGTREPLAVTFERPLDHALLQHSIRVVGPLGKISGAASVPPGDCGWRFVPREPWARGQYKLVVDRTLEDLAGNSVARVFDRDLASDAVATPDASFVPWSLI